MSCCLLFAGCCLLLAAAAAAADTLLIVLFSGSQKHDGGDPCRGGRGPGRRYCSRQGRVFWVVLRLIPRGLPADHPRNAQVELVFRRQEYQQLPEDAKQGTVTALYRSANVVWDRCQSVGRMMLSVGNRSFCLPVATSSYCFLILIRGGSQWNRLGLWGRAVGPARRRLCGGFDAAGSSNIDTTRGWRRWDPADRQHFRGLTYVKA